MAAPRKTSQKVPARGVDTPEPAGTASRRGSRTVSSKSSKVSAVLQDTVPSAPPVDPPSGGARQAERVDTHAAQQESAPTPEDDTLSFSSLAWPQRLLAALAFCGRLAPGRAMSRAQASSAVCLYPLAGAIMGFVALLPALGAAAAGIPWLQAWVYVLAMLWLTRGLHWDGLADICDAAGSGASGERFRAILKDSRVGAFGAMGLIIGLGGQLILVAACIEAQRYAPLLWAPAFARCLIFPFALLNEAHPQATLGRLVFPGVGTPATAVVTGLTVISGLWCIGFLPFIVALLLALCAGLYLSRLAQANGGYNGDFFGALVISGEIAALAGAAFSFS